MTQLPDNCPRTTDDAEVEVMSINPATAQDHTVSPTSMPKEEPDAMVDDSADAEPATQPRSLDQLPAIESAIAKQCAEMHIVLVGTPKRDGSGLFMTVEAPSVEDAQGYDARKLVYDARFNYGFANAGIEMFAGPSPVGNGRYQQTWKLTRGL